MKAGSAAHASPDIVRDTPFLSLWSWCCLQGFITVTKAVSHRIVSSAFVVPLTYLLLEHNAHDTSTNLADESVNEPLKNRPRRTTDRCARDVS